VACKKKNTPAHPCCGVNCANTCFRVTACGSNANGANVQVYATNATNSILASGNTASNGVVCLGLGNWSTWSLGASASFGSGNDYTNASTMLLGNPCGRSYTLPLTPATDAATNAEANGTVNISFDRCDGVTGWANANAEVKVSLSVINSGVTDANGHVSITVAADGTNSYYVRVYRPTDNAPLNSGTFLLAAGKCADAAMRLSHNATPCNPDTEAVVTVRDCADGEPGGLRVCCRACSPDTLPRNITLTDDVGCVPAGDFFQECEASTGSITAAMHRGWLFCPSTMTFQYCGPNSAGWGLAFGRVYSGGIFQPCQAFGGGGEASVNYAVQCTDTSIQLSYYIVGACVFTDSYGNICRVTGGTNGNVLADSFTCDPFSATFTVPTFNLTGSNYGVPCATLTIPARTITVTE
jgi:hypothetical protein